MKCNKCLNDFEESKLQLSHDIPKYIGGTDLDGRHWLCEKCHEEYDNLILKECLEFVNEEFNPEERTMWMIELSKQQETLKIAFRKIAQEIRGSFFNG